MTLKFSPYIAIQLKGRDSGREFYENVLGMRFDRVDAEDHWYRLGPLNLAIEEDAGGHVFFEFESDDFAADEARLLESGCRITQTYGETSKMFVDPRGFRFHVFGRQA